MDQQSKRLATTFGVMALTGAGALIAIAKGAPATAGAMAKIKVSAMKLQFAVGEALQDEFEAFSVILGDIASWVQENPDVFSGVVKSIGILAGSTLAIKTGGWIYGAWKGFFGLFKGAGTGIPATAGIAAGGATGILGILGAGIMTGIGPLINTYQREITGEPGFLDRMIKRMNDYNFFQMSRQEHEKQMEYFV